MIVTVIVLVIKISLRVCEVYSSAKDMKNAFIFERSLVGELLNYAENLERKLNMIKM